LSSPGGDLGVSHSERAQVHSEKGGRHLVVIPWRGFRCFTPQDAGMRRHVAD